jgi:exodeoxyribonuclease VII small subunit
MAKKKLETDFGKGFTELEEIAAWFEQGEPDLDAGLKKFERAMELSKTLRERLTQAENTIKEIKSKQA